MSRTRGDGMESLVGVIKRTPASFKLLAGTARSLEACKSANRISPRWPIPEWSSGMIHEAELAAAGRDKREQGDMKCGDVEELVSTWDLLLGLSIGLAKCFAFSVHSPRKYMAAVNIREPQYP